MSEFFERTAELGTIERGKLADLVLLDRNPLDDIANTRSIAAVVADGQLYTRAEIDGILKAVAQAAQVAR